MGSFTGILGTGRRSGARRLLPLVLGLAAACALACSGGGDGTPTVDDVRRALDAGRLEQAAALLDEVPPDALSRARVARELAAVRKASDERRARFEKVVASIPDANQREVVDELRAIQRAAVDPEFANQVEDTLARLPELYRTSATVAPPRRPGESLSGPAPIEPAAGGYPSLGALPDAPSSGRPAAPESERVARRAPPSDARSDAPSVGEPGTRARPADARPLRERARAALSGGQLAEARELLLAAAQAEARASLRQEDLWEADALLERLTLREELVDAGPRGDGIRLDAEGAVLDGEPTPWGELDAATWKRLAGGVELSGRALRGLVRERILARDVAGALELLHRLLEEGRVLEADAFRIVAATRYESVPHEGYVWVDGTFLSTREARERERVALVRDLTGSFVRVKPGQNVEAQWSALLDVANTDEASHALRRRFERLTDRLVADPLFDRLERIAALRRGLDAARAEALALIFDEEEYFYPYVPPECPPERAKDYPAVQRRVDELVGRVRVAWRATDSMQLAGRASGLLAELRWQLRAAETLGRPLELPDELPEYVLVQPIDEPIDVKTFAWDAAERADLDYAKGVVALNRERWSEAFPEDEIDLLAANAAEQRQVEITNEYRRMLGRLPLAWNPRLQRAAQDHSRYMSDTGDFGHFESNPETETPFHRMRRRGYDHGVSENCYMGGGDPQGAHGGWCRSSGHHRNLLMAGHRELASAVSGGYWTQNFGTGTDFVSSLR
ncbi:MAG: CAP domain-containing protein [Planctomycetota bacterium]